MSPIHSRPFAGDTDIAAITQFLLDTYALTHTLRNWEPRRWQGRVYHRDDADRVAYIARLPELVRLWHDDDGTLLGAVIPEYDGGAFLHVHPAHRSLDSEMVAWAESALFQTNDDGQRWLEVWGYDDDAPRTALLEQRGYTQTADYENLHRRDMSAPVPDMGVPVGYTVRTARRHADDWHGQAALLNAAFNRTIHSAEEYRNFQSAPIYRPELDMVVEAPDGTLVATAGFTAHERESFAVVEPVCTHPDHQGLGLARAAIAAGLRRVQALGIQAAYVGAWHSNAAANHTYERMGFISHARNRLWRRTW